MEKRIRRGGKQAPKWRVLRILVLALSEPAERLAELARADLDVLVPPLAKGDAYGGRERNLRQAIEDLLPTPKAPAAPTAQALDPVAAFHAEIEAAGKDWSRLNTPPQPNVTRAEAARRAGGERNLRRMEALRAVESEQGEEYHRLATRRDLTGSAREELEANWQRKHEAWKASLDATDRRLFQVLWERRDRILDKYLYHPTELLEFQRVDPEPTEVVVPDLVALVGQDRAREILLAALQRPASFCLNSDRPERTPPSVVTARTASAGATAPLLRALAQESAATLAVPQFHLVDSPRLGPLYLVMAQRFPLREAVLESHAPLANVTLSRFSARGQYVLWLVSEGRQAEALTEFAGLAGLLAKREIRPSLPDGGWRALAAMGKGAEACDFLLALFEKDPQIPEIGELTELAPKAGRIKEVRAMADRLGQRPEVAIAARAKALEIAKDVLLTGDDPEGAVEFMRRLAALPPSDPDSNNLRFRAAEALVNLGLCLGQPAWVDDGIEPFVRIGLEKADDDRPNLLPVLFRAKKYDRILEITEAQLAASGPLVQRPGAGQGRALSLRFQALVELGRMAEALELLRSDVRWNYADVSEMTDTAVTVAAARALQATGAPREARRILEATILQSPGSDQAYALLCAWAQLEALPFLDRLVRLFPFEERPLIWRARVLLEAGQLYLAEKVVRDAIRIDPSDGEQHAPHRMLAYAVLAEILRQRGETKEAEFFEGVGRAIRKSEQADLLAENSLKQRAEAMYRESLEGFADAYCIQSRLARSLYEQGRLEEAMRHYRRAFELMPDSFGRMESHCFGCEQVFSGAEPQRLAETVFQEAMARDPAKPQTHYLLGYLRLEQRRFDEAAGHFRRALELDPRYLNAWLRLAAVEPQLTSPPVASSTLLHALRLNPLLLDFDYDLRRRGRTDYVGLWQAVREVHAERGKFDAELDASLLPMRGKTYEKRPRRAAQLLESAWDWPLMQAIENRLRD